MTQQGPSQISYRVNDFAGFRRALLTPLHDEKQLADWSPKASDLGLQVLEWWAYLGDILAFYNERIANNSYLSTAAGPQAPPQSNAAGLAGLLGYRTQPATTAQGVLAAIRRPGPSDEDLVIGPGLQIVSTRQIASTPAAGVKAQQPFETDGDATSFAGPSDVVIGLLPDEDLFQPVDATPEISGHPKSVLLAGRATVQSSESLLLVKRGWDGTTGGWALTTVLSATTQTDLNGSANTRVILDSNNNWTGITDASPKASDYQLLRATATALLWTISDVSGDTSPDPVVPLATVVRGVAPGDNVLFTGLGAAPHEILTRVVGYAEDVVAVPPAGAVIRAAPSPPPQAFVPRTTLTVRATNADKLQNLKKADAGRITVRYALREAGTLIPTPVTTLALSALKQQDGVYVTVPAPLRELENARVALQDVTGAGLLAAASHDPQASPGMVKLAAVKPPATDSDSSPAELQAPISLLADLVHVSGGTTVQDEVLGDGDAATAGQIFTLQHSPLVYLPAQQPQGQPASTLTVTVDEAPWSEVPTFYGQPPDATVYLVNRLADGRPQVRFGDGSNGARLPTGTGNVKASYRYGLVLEPPPPGRLSTVLQPQPDLATMSNPVPLTPGTAAEPTVTTAKNAHSGIKLLGQAAVSPGDYEQIAVTVPGVTRARAYWAWDEDLQSRGINLYVDGHDTVAAVLAKLPLARSRLPVAVRSARAVDLTITYQLAHHRWASQETISQHAGEAVTSLLSPRRMTIGQRLYHSQLEAAVMVSGVSAVVQRQISRVGSTRDDGRAAAAGPAEPSLDPGPGGYFRLAGLTIGMVAHG
jgi:predicted phage baseplate assembly protein